MCGAPLPGSANLSLCEQQRERGFVTGGDQHKIKPHSANVGFGIGQINGALLG